MTRIKRITMIPPLLSSEYLLEELNRYPTETIPECEDPGYSYGYDTGNESALWQAVIIQAILDTLSIATNAHARRYKAQSILWLSLNNKDFILVCEMAGLIPSSVIKIANKAIKRHIASNRKKFHMCKLRNRKLKDKCIKYQVPEKIFLNLKP
jgi:hypothetical protein